VAKGHNLAVFEATKMHCEIVAEIDGTVDQVTAVVGIPVAADDVLIEITD
jgi:geranyl-CoA carboxylase alpha subunit